jgi:HD superfamily phosphodiesterase
MNRDIEKLRKEVAALYATKHTGRADWADWMHDGHVLLVANAARDIALRFGGDPDLAEAAGLLHDAADAVMKREDPQHEEKSLAMAREMLTRCGFNNEEISIVVDDAITKHSCHGDVRPATDEGKAMAAADGYVHLTSDFYAVAEERRSKVQSPAEISAWLLPKIERDFNGKITFDALREEVRPDYERIKARFQ